MKHTLRILAGLLLLMSTAVAQSNPATMPACGFGLLRHYQQQRDPAINQRSAQAQSVFQQQLIKQREASAQDVVYTLPVVVHVIHNGEAIGTGGNPSDADIQAMIGVLNTGFRKTGPQSGGVDIGIQFQLAIRSPHCGSTTGINRVNGSGVPNYTSGGIATYASGSADELAIKSLSRWPNTDYINIWIVNKIDGNPNAGGFAYFPELNSALDDGITVCAGTVNGTNKTIVHEMGHVFNLIHTFNDADETSCPSVTACATTGDQVCDTEPVRYGIPCSTTLNSCTEAPFQIADASFNYTVLNNYMGYTDCQWMFTQGQKDRMRAALLAFRPGLLNSGGLSVSAASPAMACSVTAANGLSENYGVGRVTFNTLDVYSNTSKGDGAFYIDRTCNQRTTLTSGQAYSLVIQGVYDGNTEYLQAYIDYNGDGDFSDSGEIVLNTTGSSATVIVNIPASSVTFNKPLRLRIVGDNIDGAAPTSCSLNGSVSHGVGQIEDYTVIVVPRTVTSIASGSWTTPATWSCACVPGASDIVSIQAAHTVSIGSGLKQALNLNLLGHLQYVAGGQLKLVGN